MLGDARDAEVLDQHFQTALADLPVELVIGPAKARVTAHFAPEQAAARKAALEALDSRRYFRLLDDLDRLLDDPPQTAAATAPADEILPQAVARAYRRTKRRMRRARRAPAGAGRDVALHEARKAAKRARYAADAAEPVFGKQARRFAKRMKAVQSVLGDHQDAVTARTVAREHRHAGAPGGRERLQLRPAQRARAPRRGGVPAAGPVGMAASGPPQGPAVARRPR